jgi:hypothetical protein
VKPCPNIPSDCEKEERGEEDEEEDEEELAPLIKRPSKGPTLLKMSERD